MSENQKNNNQQENDIHKDQVADQELNDSSEKIEDILVCGKECSEAQDKLMRITADFSNYRIRTQKERTQSLQRGQSVILEKLLTVVDDIDRAIQEAKKQNLTDQSWIKGFELIAKSTYQLLADHNVSPISQVETFDPTLHEALTSVEIEGKESGAIIDVMQTGFMIGDRVLRPAKVTVAK